VRAQNFLEADLLCGLKYFFRESLRGGILSVTPLNFNFAHRVCSGAYPRTTYRMHKT